MGHMVAKDIYQKLHQKIDNLTARVPYNETLYAILKELYSAEEAELVVKMPYGLSTIDRIAKITGLESQKAKRMLAQLAAKGLVLDFYHEDTPYYAPSPMVIGIFEFTMMRSGKELDHKKIAKLFYRFLTEDNAFYAANLSSGQQVSVMRTVPYEESILPEQYVEVLDYEKATAIVEQATRWGIGTCSCRHEKFHVDKKQCDVPLESCTTFGVAVEFAVRNGFARDISKQEMLDLVARSKDMGLVLSADNVRNNVQYMCHCCGCCCNYLAGLSKWGFTNAVVSSSYIARFDDENCHGCGDCERACPIDAIKMEKLDSEEAREKKKKRRPQINDAYCIGCGVCASKCKREAMHLVARPQRIFTPADTFEKTILLALEQGTLQNLIFDNPQSVGQDFLRGLLGGFLRLSPVKKTLMSNTLRSIFLGSLRTGIKLQGKSWITEAIASK